MSFNNGFKCPNCGPVQESKKKTIKKVQYTVCKICEAIVTPWQRPLNERAGRCGNCGNAHFELKIHNHELLRRCRHCDEVFNTDSGKVLRKGKEGQNG